MVAEIPFDPTNHHNALKCPYCNPEGLTFAPPKPAPDAPDHTDLMVTPESLDAFMDKNPLPEPDVMRESPLDLAWEEINALGGVPEQNNSYDQGCVDMVGKALEIIEKFGGGDPAPKRSRLSAPVPPASGPVTTEQLDRLQFGRDLHERPVPPADGTQWIYEQATARNFNGDPCGWEERRSDTQPAMTWDMVRNVRREPSPPCTGAAEPVAGDREAIVRLIYEAGSPSDPKDSWKEAQRIADAILSLPVQPGAGERLAEIGKTLEGRAAAYRKNGGMLFSGFTVADELDEYSMRALFRQAPHSSSEGGR